MRLSGAIETFLVFLPRRLERTIVGSGGGFFVACNLRCCAHTPRPRGNLAHGAYTCVYAIGREGGREGGRNRDTDNYRSRDLVSRMQPFGSGAESPLDPANKGGKKHLGKKREREEYRDQSPSRSMHFPIATDSCPRLYETTRQELAEN